MGVFNVILGTYARAIPTPEGPIKQEVAEMTPIEFLVNQVDDQIDDAVAVTDDPYAVADDAEAVTDPYAVADDAKASSGSEIDDAKAAYESMDDDIEQAIAEAQADDPMVSAVFKSLECL